MGMGSNMFVGYGDVVTPQELQQMLQLGRTKTYSLLKQGKIKSKRIDREYRIRKVDIIKYLEED